MKRTLLLACLVCAAFVTPAFAEALNNYQVTGPVLEISDSKIVVQKGKSKWEIGRDAATVVPADVKVGSKVTIDYVMTAKKVVLKEGKKAAKK